MLDRRLLLRVSLIVVVELSVSAVQYILSARETRIQSGHIVHLCSHQKPRVLQQYLVLLIARVLLRAPKSRFFRESGRAPVCVSEYSYVCVVENSTAY